MHQTNFRILRILFHSLIDTFVSPSGLWDVSPLVRWLTPPAEICRPPG